MKGSLLGGIAALVVLVMTSSAYAETQFDLSGQLRFRPEMRDNKDFNDSADDEQAFIGSRTRLTVKASVNEDVFAKITIQDVRQWGEESNVQTSKEQQALDIFEGYFQINKILDSPVSLKAGRQTLVYGDQRLLGNLGWVDQARTHDALKVMVNLDMVSIDLFAAKEAETGSPSKDKYDDDLLGAYAIVKITKGVTLDLYLLNWKTGATDANGAAIQGKNINTYGARLAAKINAIDFTAEYAAQSGDWAKGVDQEASALAVRAGYTLPFLGFRIGAEYDYGSGDDNPNDNTNKSFVFPFHTNHGKYGYMDYFSWGNMQDIQINLSLKPTKGVVLKADYHMFELAEGKGDWLDVVGTGTFLSATGATGDSTDAGDELDLTAVYKAMDNLKLVGGYSIFNPGDAVKERNGGKTDQSTWGYFMAIFTF